MIKPMLKTGQQSCYVLMIWEIQENFTLGTRQALYSRKKFTTQKNVWNLVNCNKSTWAPFYITVFNYNLHGINRKTLSQILRRYQKKFLEYVPTNVMSTQYFSISKSS